MLHRGTPNSTRRPRTMLTLCFLRRGHEHEYGTTEYNLDAELFARLDPSVQPLFRARGSLTSPGRSAGTERLPPGSPWRS
jgi:hypothetical protein